MTAGAEDHHDGDCMSVEIANESGVGADEAALAALARHVLDEMRVHPLAELSVLLVDELAMTELHVRWMGERGPTDVLAFPMDELRPPQPGGSHAEHSGAVLDGIPALLGDVVICPQVAMDQARRAGQDVREEMELLTVHGILHLLGYDHAEPGEHATMFGLQDRLLAKWRSQREPDAAGPDTVGSEAGGSDAAAEASGPGTPDREADHTGEGAG
jgi:probable rRNA maturation factor